MSYRVRTPEGEMEYGSLYDIANALRHGLVEGDDELLVPGQTTWVRVADHSALRAHVRPGAGLRPGSVLGGSSSAPPSRRRWSRSPESSPTGATGWWLAPWWSRCGFRPGSRCARHGFARGTG